MAYTRVYKTKDSGERVDFPSGMRRDTDAGKPRLDLIPQPMLVRLGELMARGAEKYGANNWQLADSEEELARFKASAYRHFVAWQNGEYDEDHAVATVFNIFAYETIKARLEQNEPVNAAAEADEDDDSETDWDSHEYTECLNFICIAQGFVHCRHCEQHV